MSVKYLSQNKIFEKKPPFKGAKKVYIFCEGEQREVAYFNYFKEISSNLNIIPIPSEDGKSDPDKLKQKAEELFFGNAPDYILSQEYKDEVWFVIDTDRWNEGGEINSLRSFVKKKNESNKEKKPSNESWFVAQSNPSFEIWLYYHFHADKPKNEEVKTFTSLKKFVDSKIKGGFDSRKMPVEIQQATSNAEKNFESVNGQPDLYSTEVFNLAKLIISFTKTLLDKYRDELKNNRPAG